MATRFPFGLARKIRWIAPDGERWIRPAYDATGIEPWSSQEGNQSAFQGSDEIQDGSIRPYLTGDDPRDIAWIYSNSLLGPHLQRVRASLPEPVRLDLRPDGLTPQALEKHLSELATQIMRAKHAGAPVELHQARPAEQGDLLITEIEPALDWLARL